MCVCSHILNESKKKNKTKMTPGIDPSTVAAIVTGRHGNGLDPLHTRQSKKQHTHTEKSASHSLKVRVVIIIIIPGDIQNIQYFVRACYFFDFKSEPSQRGSLHDVIVPNGWGGTHTPKEREEGFGIDHNVTPLSLSCAPPPPDKEKGITRTQVNSTFVKISRRFHPLVTCRHAALHGQWPDWFTADFIFFFFFRSL